MLPCTCWQAEKEKDLREWTTGMVSFDRILSGLKEVSARKVSEPSSSSSNEDDTPKQQSSKGGKKVSKGQILVPRARRVVRSCCCSCLSSGGLCVCMRLPAPSGRYGQAENASQLHVGVGQQRQQQQQQ